MSLAETILYVSILSENSCGQLRPVRDVWIETTTCAASSAHSKVTSRKGRKDWN